MILRKVKISTHSIHSIECKVVAVFKVIVQVVDISSIYYWIYVVETYSYSPFVAFDKIRYLSVTCARWYCCIAFLYYYFWVLENRWGIFALKWEDCIGWRTKPSSKLKVIKRLWNIVVYALPLRCSTLLKGNFDFRWNFTFLRYNFLERDIEILLSTKI